MHAGTTRTARTAAATALLVAGLAVPAAASHDGTTHVPEPQVGFDDPRGDVTSDDGGALSEQQRLRRPAYDIVGVEAGFAGGDLLVDVALASSIPSQLDNTAILVLSDTPDPDAATRLWVFSAEGSADGERLGFIGGDVEILELDCAWTAAFPERHARFTVPVEECELDLRQELFLGVAVQESSPDGTMSDSAPSEDAPTLPGPLEVPGTDRPVPQARDVADTCDDQPRDAFTDDDGSPFEASIDCIAGYGITQGVTATTYGGSLTLTAPETATFLDRTLREAGVALPAPGDVCPGDGGDLRESVERMIAAGVVDESACEPGPTTRATMAQWTAAALELGGIELDAATDWYIDDEDLAAAQDAINGISDLGIVQGIGDARFAPADLLTRAQMAVFVSRTLDALLA